MAATPTLISVPLHCLSGEADSEILYFGKLKFVGAKLL